MLKLSKEFLRKQDQIVYLFAHILESKNQRLKDRALELMQLKMKGKISRDELIEKLRSCAMLV